MLPRVQRCIGVFLCLAFFTPPSAAQDRSGRELVEVIIRDGPRARAINAEVEVTRREQFARLVSPNPSVAYSREGAGFTEFLQLEQTLLPFGARGALSRAGAAATTAGEAERDARLWQLRSEAETAIAHLVAEQDRVVSTEAAVRETERLVETLRVREREGEGSRFDRLRAEQELADARLALAGAVGGMHAARAVLTALLPPDVVVTRVTITSNPPRLSIDTEALVSRAMASRRELLVLKAAESRAVHEAEAARSVRRPAPTLTAGLKQADTGRADRERGGFFGITVSMPLFDTGAREAARWQAERSRVQAEFAHVERGIRAEIAGGAEVLAVRQAALASLPDDAAAEELVRTAEVGYREGEMGILGLLDAVRTAARARERNIEVRLGTRLAQIALERAVGEVLWP